MRIANPIYDVVFKYLMQDNKVAKLILSAIIGEDIVELEMRPQEIPINVERPDETGMITHYLSVIRMDFSARIKTKEGAYKLIIIEIQKAKLAADIMRFRKYLGEQYANPYNVEEEEVVYRKALPIVSIYFLGHILEHTQAPVIKVSRNYIDIATGDEISKKEEFIESLTHDSYIIQIPFLTEKRRNDLEILLSVFDQSQCLTPRHLLDIDDASYPEKYREVIRRLVAAITEPEIRKKMEVESDVIEEFAALDKYIAKKKQEVEKISKEVEKISKEAEKYSKEAEKYSKEAEEKGKKLQVMHKEVEETKAVLETKDKELEDKDKLLLEKEKELAKMKELIEELQKNK